MLTSRPRLDPSDHNNHAVAQSPSGLQGPSRRSPNSPEVSQTECCGGAGGCRPAEVQVLKKVLQLWWSAPVVIQVRTIVPTGPLCPLFILLERRVCVVMGKVSCIMLHKGCWVTWIVPCIILHEGVCGNVESSLYHVTLKGVW